MKRTHRSVGVSRTGGHAVVTRRPAPEEHVPEETPQSAPEPTREPAQRPDFWQKAVKK